MIFKENKEAVVTSLDKSFAEKNKTRKPKFNTALEGLQALREIAWHKAIKYRFDPVLSRTHEEYLTVLNNLIAECAA